MAVVGASRGRLAPPQLDHVGEPRVRRLPAIHAVAQLPRLAIIVYSRQVGPSAWVLTDLLTGMRIER